MVPSKVFLTSPCKRCGNYAPQFHWYTHCFYWTQYKF